MVGHLPDLDYAILTSRGDDIVVMGTPGNVQDGTFVTANQWVIWIDTSYLKRKRKINVSI